jgi:hypothetical protein
MDSPQAEKMALRRKVFLLFTIFKTPQYIWTPAHPSIQLKRQNKTYSITKKSKMRKVFLGFLSLTLLQLPMISYAATTTGSAVFQIPNFPPKVEASWEVWKGIIENHGTVVTILDKRIERNSDGGVFFVYEFQAVNNGNTYTNIARLDVFGTLYL